MVTVMRTAPPIRTDFPWPPQVNDEIEWDSCPPVLIPVAEIGFAQDHCHLEGIVKHGLERGLPGWEGQPWPHAILFEGWYWIVNGTHRSLIAWIRGEDTMFARVRAWPWRAS